MRYIYIYMRLVFGLTCVECVFAMTNYSISLYLTTFEPKSINIHFNACTTFGEVTDTTRIWSLSYVIVVVVVSDGLFSFYHRSCLRRRRRRGRCRRYSFHFFHVHQITLVNGKKPFRNVYLPTTLGATIGTFIEMFALKVDLCDKCDSSQMNGLVWFGANERVAFCERFG